MVRAGAGRREEEGRHREKRRGWRQGRETPVAATTMAVEKLCGQASLLALFFV
jgi:hypothetical protein